MTESLLVDEVPEARFGPVEPALRQLRAGNAVVVVDERGEGGLVFAACLATTALVRFAVRHSGGVINVCLPVEACDRLGLVPMRVTDPAPDGAEHFVPVDARGGSGRGFGAAERTRTIRLLGEPSTGPADLIRPGAVFPLRARPGGVLARPQHTEAALDLVRLAGLGDAAVLCGVVDDEGSVARPWHLSEFALRNGLEWLAIDELVAFRRARERHVQAAAQARIPMPQGVFSVVGYGNDVSGREVVALVHGDVAGHRALVRVHQECPVGDVFGGFCGCRARLHADMEAVVASGCGVVVYLRGGHGMRCAREGADDVEDRRDVADVLAHLSVQPSSTARAVSR